MNDTHFTSDKDQKVTLKRRDNPESKAYWEFIERTAQQARDERPSWARREAGSQDGTTQNHSPGAETTSASDPAR